jgi:hypothetical protein
MVQLQTLASSLEKMLTVYREYLVISRQKNEDLVNVDFSRMEKFNQQEKNYAEELNKLEKERQLANQTLLSETGETLTLKELAERFSETPEATLLNRLRDDLREVTTAVRELNERNLKLIEKSLEIVDHTLKSVTEFNRVSNDTYNRQGYDDQGPNAESHLSLVDVRI